jgi:hypothetical protein
MPSQKPETANHYLVPIVFPIRVNSIEFVLIRAKEFILHDSE